MITLEKLKALADAATPGPWNHNSYESGTEYVAMRQAKPYPYLNPDHSDANGYVGAHMFLRDVSKFEDCIESLENEKWSNAEFIAASREAVPALIEEVRILRVCLKDMSDGGWVYCTKALAASIERLP